MADKKISQLTELALADVADDDKLVIVDTGSTETKRIDVSNFRFLKKVGTAFIGGDLTGDTRGANVIDIQASRTASTKIARNGKCIAVGNDNTANGVGSDTGNVKSIAIGNSNTASVYVEGLGVVAIGNSNTCAPTVVSVGIGISNTANGDYATAIGVSNTANGLRGTAIGNSNSAAGGVAVGRSNSANGYKPVAIGSGNTANGYFLLAIGDGNTSSGGYESITIGRNNTTSSAYSMSFGMNNVVSNMRSTAIGRNNTVTSSNSHGFGQNVKTTVDKTLEIGHWNNTATRSGAIRIHGETGMVSMTLQDRSTEYTDGGATKGSEADNSLGREMYAIRRNGDSIILDVNIGGTVKNVTLGTAT
jgi:hypothetical protein